MTLKLIREGRWDRQVRTTYLLGEDSRKDGKGREFFSSREGRRQSDKDHGSIRY